MKVHNLAPSVFAFLHALANASELKSFDRFCQLIKLAKSEQTHTRCAIPVNALSERHFKIQSGFLAIARFLKTLKKNNFGQHYFVTSEGKHNCTIN